MSEFDLYLRFFYKNKIYKNKNKIYKNKNKNKIYNNKNIN